MPRASHPISLHRAGVLAMLAPGWGDWHAGRPFRAAALLTVFFVFLAWGSWVMAELIVGTMTAFFNEPQRVWELDPMLQLAISGVGMVWVWCLGIATAILAALKHFHLEGRTPDRAPWFATLASWCAPGTGHIYLERRTFGLLLLILFLASIALLMPVIGGVLSSAQAFGGTLRLDGANPFAMIASVKSFAGSLELDVRLSPAWQLHTIVRAVAIADACALLAMPRPTKPGDDLLLSPPSPRPDWETSSTAKLLGTLALGWICPGSGQLLQGRTRLGWGFFGLHYGLLLIAAAAVHADVAAAQDVGVVMPITLAVRVIASIEGCWRMPRPTSAPPADG